MQVFLHTTAEFVTGALAIGFTLVGLAEIGDRPKDGVVGLPRLLQLVFIA